MRQIRMIAFVAGLAAVALLILAVPGCATSDRDKLLQYREAFSTARDAALVARTKQVINADLYRQISDVDNVAIATMNDLAVKIDAGIPIEKAVWSSLASQLASIKAGTEGRPPPATRQAMTSLAAFELALLLLKAVQSAAIAGRQEIDPDTAAEILKHESLSIAARDAQLAKDAGSDNP